MKSGLEDRNNLAEEIADKILEAVSMKSGLEDRNNQATQVLLPLPKMSQ